MFEGTFGPIWVLGYIPISKMHHFQKVWLFICHFKNCDIFTCCRLYWTANSLRRHVKNFKANLKRQRPCNAEKFNMKTIVVVRGCFGRRVFALLFLKHSNSDEVICSVMNPEKVKYRGFQLKMPCFKIGYTFWP